MQELSMNILDIAQNSVRAGAKLVEISLDEDTGSGRLRLRIRDDGCGMEEEMLRTVTDPFVTSRKTRKVGLGLPFLKLAAEQTGGGMSLQSEVGKGTTVAAEFALGHIDLMPLGDIGETLAALCAGSPDIDFLFVFTKDSHRFTFDTREVRSLLEGVSLSQPAVSVFIKEYVNEHMDAVQKGRETEA